MKKSFNKSNQFYYIISYLLIICSVQFLFSCQTEKKSQPSGALNFSEDMIKEIYISYVLYVKVAQLKYKGSSLDNAKTILEYANENVRKGYSIKKEIVDMIVTFGSQRQWEWVVEDRRQMFNPHSALHALTLLTLQTDKEKRMPTFPEIQRIAKNAVKDL